MKKLLLAALTLTLSACTMMYPATDYAFSKQPAGAALMSSGTVSVKRDAAMVMTSVSVSGLLPNTYYVAHYHKQGAASTNPCESGGAPIMSSMIVGQTDGMGMLKLSGSVASAEVMDATYFNIHTAKDASGAPADGGVVCTSVKMM